MGNRENNNQRAWLGVALVLFGGYFLFRNLDLIPDFIPYYLFGWETVFIIIGVSMLATRRREGFLFLGIGVFFLIPDIFYLPDFRIRDWWPIILIAVGISIVLRRRDDLSKKKRSESDDYIENTSIFGGSETSYASQRLQGGKITSIFGGSEVDLTRAQMEGEEIIIDIFCFFGGSGFKVPNDWTVINESFVIFGGFSDKRPIANEVGEGPQKVLRIKGSVIFGGAEIKGY